MNDVFVIPIQNLFMIDYNDKTSGTCCSIDDGMCRDIRQQSYQGVCVCMCKRPTTRSGHVDKE